MVRQQEAAGERESDDAHIEVEPPAHGYFGAHHPNLVARTLLHVPVPCQPLSVPFAVLLLRHGNLLAKISGKNCADAAIRAR